MPPEDQAEVGKTASEDSGGLAQPAEATEAVQAAKWKVGDTEYETPDAMAEAFRKFQGEYTRNRQEYKKLRDESAVSREVLSVIRSDPKLLAEVRQRVGAGATPAQAASDTLSAHADGGDPRIVEMWGEIDTWRQERATQSFASGHPDLTEEDWDGIESYITENSEWLSDSKLSYDRMIEIAYHVAVLPGRSGKLIEQGQEMKEQEIRKGAQSRSLGTQAPTAGAGVQSKPYKDMTSAERHAYAQNVYKQMGTGQR